jgi:uncharacterized protein YbaA (DUF1428 family)
MTYVDGFVFVVKKDKIDEYKKMASMGGKIWKKHGALVYLECMGDDLHPDMGPMKCVTFPELVKLKKNETAWFSFIIYKSKEHRDSVNKKVMADPMMGKEWKDKPMPFDMKRLAYGGFQAIVEEKK